MTSKLQQVLWDAKTNDLIIYCQQDTEVTALVLDSYPEYLHLLIGDEKVYMSYEKLREMQAEFVTCV